MDEKRFVNLWHEAGGSFGAAEAFHDLRARYCGPDRHYHSASHIVRCLDWYDHAAAALGVSPVVEMAIWCHDVVYWPESQSNEKESVKWFSTQADGVLLRSFVDAVSKTILATRHTSVPESLAEKFMVDVDLAGLGQPWQQFFRDTQNLRREFKSVTEETFFVAQSKFLQKLANRPFIFSTPFFRNAFEQSARDNIARLVEQYLPSTDLAT